MDYFKKIVSEPYKSLLIVLFIIAMTAGVYWQVGSHQFITFDDDMYITLNEKVKSGLSLQGLKYAFGFSKVTYWHPVTWLSHQLDCELFGLNAGIHHLINALFHILNSVLLFVVLRKMTGSHWRSAFAAALFALHPVNVDTVAWVAERKNVLSTFFWMLTMLTYFYYLENPRLTKYFLMLFLFILGLLSKPMLVTLPFVLLLMDYWPLKRIRFDYIQQDKKKKGAGPQFSYQGVAVSRLIAEKIPLLVFSIGAIVVASLSIRWGGFNVGVAYVPMGLRIENAIVSYVLYLWKMICPINLSFYYPYPKSIPFWEVAGAGALLIGISVVALRLIFRAPYLFVGWLWFLGTLVPVSGIMQGGLWPEIAERWAYVPYIGLFITVSWGIHDIVHGRRYEKETLSVAASAVLLTLMVLTWRQAGYWLNDMTLYTHALKANPENFVAHANIGNVYVAKKKYDQAADHFKAALRLNYNDVLLLDNLGNLYYETGDKEKSINYYSEALRYVPDDLKANFRLGIIFSELGEIDKAISRFSHLIKIDPEYPDGYYNLGVVLAKKGDKEKAKEYLLTAIKIKPQDAESHYSLGIILMNQGKVNDAIYHFSQAVKIDPKHKEARNSLNMALTIKNKIGEDIASKLEQQRLKEPNNPELLQKLAVVYSMRGNNAKALDLLKRFVKLKPDDPNGYYNIACIYSKERKVDDAAKWLTESIDKGFKDWTLLKKDQDLANLRTTAFYKDLIKKNHG
jgi:protein O-mannosyl-transferase